jgi:hypothetical protein
MIHQLTQPLAKTQEHPGSQVPGEKTAWQHLSLNQKAAVYLIICLIMNDNDITIDFFSCREVYGSFTDFALFKANGLVI